jgi:hypothetical protein
VKYFLEQRAQGDCEIIHMGIRDALHIPIEDHARIRAQYADWEVACRVDGDIMRGEGRVFDTPEDQIKYTRDLREFPWPDYWPILGAVDFCHAGGSATAHAFAYVQGIWDRANDIIYITRCLKLRGGLPTDHIAAIKTERLWDSRIIWPHDGHVRDLVGGETFAGIYRRGGLNMDSGHATFPDGNTYDYEGSLAAMGSRLKRGGLRVPAHEAERNGLIFPWASQWRFLGSYSSRSAAKPLRSGGNFIRRALATGA